MIQVKLFSCIDRLSIKCLFCRFASRFRPYGLLGSDGVKKKKKSHTIKYSPSVGFLWGCLSWSRVRQSELCRCSWLCSSGLNAGNANPHGQLHNTVAACGETCCVTDIFIKSDDPFTSWTCLIKGPSDTHIHTLCSLLSIFCEMLGGKKEGKNVGLHAHMQASPQQQRFFNPLSAKLRQTEEDDGGTGVFKEIKRLCERVGTVEGIIAKGERVGAIWNGMMSMDDLW